MQEKMRLYLKIATWMLLFVSCRDDEKRRNNLKREIKILFSGNETNSMKEIFRYKNP